MLILGQFLLPLNIFYSRLKHPTDDLAIFIGNPKRLHLALIGEPLTDSASYLPTRATPRTLLHSSNTALKACLIESDSAASAYKHLHGSQTRCDDWIYAKSIQCIKMTRRCQASHLRRYPLRHTLPSHCRDDSGTPRPMTRLYHKLISHYNESMVYS